MGAYINVKSFAKNKIPKKEKRLFWIVSLPTKLIISIPMSIRITCFTKQCQELKLAF